MPDDLLLPTVNELVDAINAQTLTLAEVTSKLDALTMDVQACIDICERVAVVQARGLQIPILGVALPAKEKRANGHDGVI